MALAGNIGLTCCVRWLAIKARSSIPPCRTTRASSGSMGLTVRQSLGSLKSPDPYQWLRDRIALARACSWRKVATLSNHPLLRRMLMLSGRSCSEGRIFFVSGSTCKSPCAATCACHVQHIKAIVYCLLCVDGSATMFKCWMRSKAKRRLSRCMSTFLASQTSARDS